MFKKLKGLLTKKRVTALVALLVSHGYLGSEALGLLDTVQSITETCPK